MSTDTSPQESSTPPGNPFNVGNFLAAFVGFAAERWLHYGELSNADDLKAGKKKPKKQGKMHPKNFIQSSLKEFAKAYPDTPEEAGSDTQKWLLRQITDPKEIWLLVEALGAARGVIGKLGRQSSKGKKKTGKKKETPDAATLKPLVEAGAAAPASASKPKKSGKAKEKEKAG